MTTPALFVLSLALVCSICGIASEQTADYDSTDKMRLSKLDVTMDSHWANQFDKHYLHNEILDETTLKSKTNDKSFEENDTKVATLNMRNINLEKYHPKKLKGLKKKSESDIELNKRDLTLKEREFAANEKDLAVKGRDLAANEKDLAVNARVKRKAAVPVVVNPNDPRCDSFRLDLKESRSGYITHPHNIHSPNKYYYNNSNCVFVIEAPVGSVVKLTFVDMFRIEYNPQCTYDFLEIRDGLHGYAKLIDKVCGQAFPRQMTSSGPYVWLKFRSDDTIEYEGFKILVEFKVEASSYKIPDSCYIPFTNEKKGAIDDKSIDAECKAGSANHPLDVLWTITTDEEHKIYLNFTNYELKKPNECEENVIQVFGSVIELDAKLEQYCGSVASSVTTKDPVGNIMHVRFYASQTSKADSKFRATFNPFRLLNQAVEGVKCRDEDEFDCEDNTCIDIGLACDHEAHCRLKADEDVSYCDKVQSSAVEETHILVILIIFSLILSSMCFVFLFKCIRKLYQDHKIIKDHLRRSTEDRLDTIEGNRLTLDPHKLQMDSEPRASLDRDNQTNEMYKKKRSFSKHKQSSIDSDYIIERETQIDLEEEPWRREVDSMPIEAEDIRIERNGRTRRSDLSRKEESMRSRTKGTDDSKERKEIRDASVGAPDTKESACQTRESLFQTDPPPSSDGSGTNSRGFSTFGYSGATIARKSPPAATNTSEIKIELLKQIPPEPKLQKKTDRRPISTETTRSAPDVIIVSKPIR